MNTINENNASNANVDDLDENDKNCNLNHKNANQKKEVSIQNEHSNIYHK